MSAARRARLFPRRAGSEHDPEKCEAVFPRDKRGTRLRGDHAPNKNLKRDDDSSDLIAL
jgi:hypothetical protein